MKRQSAKEITRETAKSELLNILKPGDTVYCLLRHVSRSGMSREISFFTEGMLNLDWRIADLLDYRRGKHSGLYVEGCGMDMGFAVVYDVSRALFPDGFGVKGEGPLGHEVRPDTKEHAAEAVSKGVKFWGRNGDTSGWDNDGGYALTHRWI